MADDLDALVQSGVNLHKAIAMGDEAPSGGAAKPKPRRARGYPDVESPAEDKGEGPEAAETYSTRLY